MSCRSLAQPGIASGHALCECRRMSACFSDNRGVDYVYNRNYRCRVSMIPGAVSVALVAWGMNSYGRDLSASESERTKQRFLPFQVDIDRPSPEQTRRRSRFHSDKPTRHFLPPPLVQAAPIPPSPMSTGLQDLLGPPSCELDFFLYR